jgi:hypothetical protein
MYFAYYRYYWESTGITGKVEALLEIVHAGSNERSAGSYGYSSGIARHRLQVVQDRISKFRAVNSAV